VDIPYVSSRHPGNVSVDEFLKNPKLGCNCQLLVLGALKKAGFDMPSDMGIDQGERFGSRELWEDVQFTKFVAMPLRTARFVAPYDSDPSNGLRGPFEKFDLYFFSPPGIDAFSDTYDYKNLHIGLLIEIRSDYKRRIFHNSRPGPSTIWYRSDFDRKGYNLFGIKRPLVKK